MLAWLLLLLASPALAQNIFSQSGSSPDWGGLVPRLLAAAPDQVAALHWGPVQAGLGDTVRTGQMGQRPVVSWRGDGDSLYSLLLVDNGIASLNGSQFVHWFLVNIPGTDPDRGTETIEYIEPFSAELKADGSGLDATAPPHPMLLLVYRQLGSITVDETQAGCNPTVLTDRVVDKVTLATKYNLELVAGTYINVFSGPDAVAQVCRTSRCGGSPFPVPLPGVNDGPECEVGGQPSYNRARRYRLRY